MRQLHTADAGKGGIKLRQHPIGLSIAALLQTLAGGEVNQSVAMFKGKTAPRLLLLRVYRPIDLFQFRQRSQLLQPAFSHRRVGLISRRHQPHHLPVEPLHEPLLKFRRRVAHRLARQQRQHAAVDS